MRMLDQIRALIDCVAVNYGKVPNVLLLLTEEFEALRQDMDPGGESFGFGATYVRIGGTLVTSRKGLVPEEESEARPPEAPHPLYPERTSNRGKFDQFDARLWFRGEAPRFVVPPPLPPITPRTLGIEF